MGFFPRVILLLIVALGALPAPASAEAAGEPGPGVAQPALSPLEAKDPRGMRRAGAAADEDRHKETPVYEAFRVIVALAIVLGAIFGLRWFSRRFLGIQTPGNGAGVVQVLSQTMLGPKQQLLLIQVGRRIVLVSNSGGQMHPLCEIGDPEEVVSLMGQLQHKKSEPSARTFMSVFGRAGAQFGGKNDSKQTAEPARPAREEPADALESTQQEITGLLEKVRTMSRSFRAAP